MSWHSLGSLALPYQLQRQGVFLRTEISRLGVELTTGQTATPQRHLRGDTGPLAAIETRLSRIDAYQQNARLVATRVDASQTALGQLATLRNDTASRMLTVATAGISDEALSGAGRSAKAALNDAVSALSLRVSGQAVFSGAANTTSPLPDADAIIGAIMPLVSGLSSAQSVASTVEAAFNDPGGLFEATLYQGADAVSGAILGDGGQSVTQPTAADPAIRSLLSGLVLGALAAESSMALPVDQRRALVQSSATALVENSDALTGLQADTGDAQASVEAWLLQVSTERDALHNARNTLIGVDPYEAATRLEEARAQLETLYTVTARTSRLSLTGYL